jgi:hypothetical protein
MKLYEETFSIDDLPLEDPPLNWFVVKDEDSFTARLINCRKNNIKQGSKKCLN